MSESQVVTQEIIDSKLSSVRKCGVGLFVCLLVFGLFVGMGAKNNAERLMEEGVSAEARVVDLAVREYVGKKGRAKEDHVVNYSFIDASGSEYHSSYETGPDFFDSLKIGGTYEIRFLPDDPSNNERMSVIERQLSMVAVLVRSFIGALCGFIFFEVIRFFIGRILRKKISVPA